MESNDSSSSVRAEDHPSFDDCILKWLWSSQDQYESCNCLVFSWYTCTTEYNEKSISLRDWQIGLTFLVTDEKFPGTQRIWKSCWICRKSWRIQDDYQESQQASWSVRIKSALDSCIFPIRIAVSRTFMTGLNNNCHDEVRASWVMFVIWSVVEDRTTLCIVFMIPLLLVSTYAKKQISTLT